MADLLLEVLFLIGLPGLVLYGLLFHSRRLPAGVQLALASIEGFFGSNFLAQLRHYQHALWIARTRRGSGGCSSSSSYSVSPSSRHAYSDAASPSPVGSSGL